MSILDASAYAEALSSDTDLGQACRERIARERSWQAPELMPAEVQSALRGLVRSGKLTIERAEDARARLRVTEVSLYPFAAFEGRIWELRENLTTYDAWYVALAERLDVPLVTADAKFARSSGPHCEVEVVRP